MYKWTVTDPDLSGNTKQDIEILKKKIKEINQEMRRITRQLNREGGTDE